MLSREVAQRKNPEARGPENSQDKQGGSENRTRTDASKATGEAQEADGKPADEEGVNKPDDFSAAAVDAAAQASSDLLALVANVAQLQKAEGETLESPAAETVTEGVDDATAPGRKASPFEMMQFGPGARAIRAAQDKAEGTPLPGERVTAKAAEIGKAGGEVPSLQVAATAQPSSTMKAGSAASEFSATLKDASQLLQSMQQVAAAQAAPSASAQAAGERLAPRLGTPAWDQALGQKIVWMVNGEQQNASLTLNPPELGPLKVVLQVSNAQASATFVAAQPEVRQALEAAMPRLRDMLGEAGIQLGQATVDSGSPHQQHASERHAGRAFGLTGAADASEPAATISGTQALSGGGRGLVDTFV